MITTDGINSAQRSGTAGGAMTLEPIVLTGERTELDTNTNADTTSGRRTDTQLTKE